MSMVLHSCAAQTHCKALSDFRVLPVFDIVLELRKRVHCGTGGQNPHSIRAARIGYRASASA